MTNYSPEASSFTLRSMFSSDASPANMAQTEEQSAEQFADPLQAAPSFQTHSPARDYAEKAFQRFHQHSLSESTATTGSNDSSPTTTISTVDDSSATDPSPGSSPESPPPSTFTVGMLRPRTSDESAGPFFELQKQPPPKKGRNLKNLAVNTTRHPRAASTTSLPLQPPAEEKVASISSPAFVKPPSPPKRKATNPGLTLLTPASSKAPPQEIKLAIPPTPGLSRPGTLRHFQSSPSLPLFPGLVFQDSSRFKLAYPPTGLDTIISPVEPLQQLQLGEEEEQNFDVPLSREEKPEAYPQGPICVYEPYIDLYLEPTAEQARQYDVIMNVASEVRNPFIKYVDAEAEEPDIRIDGGGGIQYAPKRSQLATPSSGMNDVNRDGSPTTPRATPLNSSFPHSSTSGKEPEYIHIPWEHNSDIVPDLLRLAKLVDERVQQHKRVLVHCQCGVSRSASLVVAYGLYKDPTMSVQEAYDAVKMKSKWIGPNMNLIMQLQEFRTSLTRGGLLSSNRGLTPITPSSAMSEWRGPFSTNLSQPLSIISPLSASTMRAPVEQHSGAISAGPRSAPSGIKWPTSDEVPPLPSQRPRAVSAVKASSSTYVDTSGHLVPVLKVVKPEAKTAKPVMLTIPQMASSSEEQEATPTSSIMSPRSAEFAIAPLQPSHDVDSADKFGLMSPTSTEFASSPFDRTALLASLGMGSVREHDEAPRRSVSLRTRSEQRDGNDKQSPGLHSGRKLRGKISSPSIREQQQLQSLQAKIEANMTHRKTPASPLGDIDEALMSPRAPEFTKNPFALTLAVPDRQEQETATQSSMADPRSPVQTGGSPITRSILDVL